MSAVVTLLVRLLARKGSSALGEYRGGGFRQEPQSFRTTRVLFRFDQASRTPPVVNGFSRKSSGRSRSRTCPKTWVRVRSSSSQPRR